MPLSTRLALTVGACGVMVGCAGCRSHDCTLGDRYQYVTDDVGTGEITLKPSGKDHYMVSATGPSSFAGIATFSEGVLRVVFQSPGGASGTYTWHMDSSCDSGEGRLQFKTGGSGRHDSRLSAVRKP